jgi:hypothetical protein
MEKIGTFRMCEIEEILVRGAAYWASSSRCRIGIEAL